MSKSAYLAQNSRPFLALHSCEYLNFVVPIHCSISVHPSLQNSYHHLLLTRGIIILNEPYIHDVFKTF